MAERKFADIVNDFDLQQKALNKLIEFGHVDLVDFIEANQLAGPIGCMGNFKSDKTKLFKIIDFHPRARKFFFSIKWQDGRKVEKVDLKDLYEVYC